MNYLIGYLILGLLFMVPLVWNAKNRKKAALFAICILPLWIFPFALLIHTIVQTNRYSSRCVFCGEEFEATSAQERDQAIREHIIRKCEKHPFRAELEGWRSQNRALAKQYTDMEMKYLTALQREQELKELLRK